MRLSIKKATADSVSRWLQKYLDTINILQYPEEEFARFDFLVCGPYQRVCEENKLELEKKRLRPFRMKLATKVVHNIKSISNITVNYIIVYITQVLVVVTETIVKNLGLAGSSEQLGRYIPSLGC